MSEMNLRVELQQNNDSDRNLKSLADVEMEIGFDKAARLEAFFLGVLSNYVDSATWEHCLDSSRARLAELS